MRRQIDKKTKIKVLERFMNGCVRCWCLCSGDFGMWYGDYSKCIGDGDCHIHHIKPVVDGGSDEIENLIPLCAVCHKELHALEGIKLSVFLNTVPLYWLMFPKRYRVGDSIEIKSNLGEEGSRLELITEKTMEYINLGISSYQNFVELLVPFCTKEEKIWLVENRNKLLGFEE